MMLKKIWIIAAAAVLTAVIVSGFVVPALQAQQEPASSVPSVPGEVLYYLGISEGRAAVYDRDRFTVLTRLDTPLRTLPAEDRARLSRGIPVYSEEELQQYLEDYS